MTIFISKLKVWGARQSPHTIRATLMFAPVFLLVGITIIGATILFLRLSDWMPKPNTLTLKTLLGSFLLFSAITATTLASAGIWAKWLGQEGLWFIGLNRDYGKLGVGILWGCGLQVSTFVLLIMFGWLEVKQISTNSRALINVIIITLSSVNASIFEEAVFRGVLYSVLRRRWAWRLTAIVTAVFFALPHLISNRYDAQILAVFALITGGFLFAWSREITGTLWAPIGIHFAWDAAIGWLNLIASESPHLIMTTFHAPAWVSMEWGLADWIPLIIFSIGLLRLHPSKAR